MKNNILEKVFKILINPKNEWQNLTNYCERELIKLEDIEKYKPIYFLIPIFALIPALTHFLGMTIFKDIYFPEDMLKFAKNENNQQLIVYLERFKEILDNKDINKIFIISAVYYMSEILRPLIYAVLTFFLTSAFGGTKNPYRALVVAVISLIPFWIASISLVYNSPLSMIIIFIATFYTLYITYNSADSFLCIPNDNQKPFQFIIVLAILFLIINSIFGMLIQNLIIFRIIYS